MVVCIRVTTNCTLYRPSPKKWDIPRRWNWYVRSYICSATLHDVRVSSKEAFPKIQHGIEMWYSQWDGRQTSPSTLGCARFLRTVSVPTSWSRSKFVIQTQSVVRVSYCVQLQGPVPHGVERGTLVINLRRPRWTSIFGAVYLSAYHDTRIQTRRGYELGSCIGGQMEADCRDILDGRTATLNGERLGWLPSGYQKDPPPEA